MHAKAPPRVSQPDPSAMPGGACNRHARRALTGPGCVRQDGVFEGCMPKSVGSPQVHRQAMLGPIDRGRPPACTEVIAEKFCKISTSYRPSAEGLAGPGGKATLDDQTRSDAVAAIRLGCDFVRGGKCSQRRKPTSAIPSSALS